MALMLDGRKAHSLENVRLRITRIVLMLDGRKEYNLKIEDYELLEWY